MIKLSNLLFFLFTTILAISQDSLTVKGIVRDSNEKVLTSVTVSLIRASDSSLVKLALTMPDGRYEFRDVKAGSYRILASFVSFNQQYSPVFDLKADAELAAIKMEPLIQSLSGVVVQARRPMVESRLDKTVVNVDASPSNASNNVLELLEKSPGISVDRDGNISLKGKPGVTILIDGKQTYLGGEELSSLLKSMSASQLDQIEIMTQPSSRYDAAGNSGIINLRTKKSRVMGLNGSINVAYLQGNYPKSPNSFNFNLRKGKINFFSSGGYSFWQVDSDQRLVRKYRNAGLASEFAQLGWQKNTSWNHNLRLGLDYAINGNTTIGFMVNGTRTRVAAVNIADGDFFIRGADADSSIYSRSERKNIFKNYTANISFRHQLDKNGREITADLDYVQYRAKLDQYTDNQILYPFRPVNQSLLRAILPTEIDVVTAKVDYIHPLGKETKFETGLKTSLVKTDNNAPYETWDPSLHTWIDDIRKDHFAYDEHISAAYINFNKQIKKWGIQTGLRGEHTYSTGTQVLIGKSISRNYFQVFPTLYISYAMNDKNQFGVNYGRRINRPNYQDLNPFQKFQNLYTFNQGNPYLTPQFTSNIELSHIFSGKLNTSINYTVTTDIINDIIRQDDDTKASYQVKENIASNRNIGISVSYNSSLTKWWTVSAYANAFRSVYKGVVNNLALRNDINGFTFNMNNQFKFAKTWGAEVSGFYQGRSLVATMFLLDPMYVMSFGASKQVLKNKGTIKLSINDAFRLQKAIVIIQHGNIDAYVKNTWDNRRVGLTFTWRFSKGQSLQQRKKSGSSQDEQGRIGGVSPV